MAEKIKADIYIAYLDQILAGKENIEPVEDEEVEKLLLLAKTMIDTDLSVNSKLREILRKQLLDQAIKESSLSLLLKDDDKLDEEALDHVTAAGEIDNQMGTCPYCGSRSINLEGNVLLAGIKEL